MTKYTKRQYLADIAANEAAISEIKSQINAINDRVEAGETGIEFGKFNTLHDHEYELEQERRDIERRWSTRNWTYADHASYELVAANID